AGDQRALDRVVNTLYEDLHQLAQHFMRAESAGHTLQPTALVHEAYVRLIDQRETAWQDRAHFLAIASQAMRRVLVDHARARKTAKRGGECKTIQLTEAEPDMAAAEVDLILLDDAMHRLAQINPVQARLVEMRYFGGLTIEEASQVLAVPKRTLDRE